MQHLFRQKRFLFQATQGQKTPERNPDTLKIEITVVNPTLFALEIDYYRDFDFARKKMYMISQTKYRVLNWYFSR